MVSFMYVRVVVALAFSLSAHALSITAFADHDPPPAKAPFNAEQAGELQQQWAKHIGQPVVCTNSIGMRMMLIPPGEFMMGVSEKETFPDSARTCSTARICWTESRRPREAC